MLGGAWLRNGPCDTVPAPEALLGHGSHYVLMVTVALKLICTLFNLLYFNLSLRNTLPSLLRANHSIINETDTLFRDEEWGGHEALEDEEYAFCLTFRAMGKYPDNRTRVHKNLHCPL